MVRLDVSDGAQRERALDPARSFIVQAPAGSGKTELLIQRYLTLLALVDKPEEIIAITFTRKAAGEMRDRILTALHHARSEAVPDLPHERLTRELAAKVLARDRVQGWALEMNPRRLRIQTIDAFSSALTRQMPVLSHFGAPPGITEDATELYREAARRTITEVESGEEWSPSIEYLLRHLDNNLASVEAMIMRMLAKRDQWLRHIGGPKHERIERTTLEAALVHVVADEITALQRSAPDDIVDQCLPLLHYAAANLKRAGRDSPIRVWLGIDSLPAREADQRSYWEGMAQLLLTKDGGWRRSINVTNGFPPAKEAKTEQEESYFNDMKQQWLRLIESLANQDDFRERLHRLRGLPPVRYDDNQWQTLEALYKLLRLAGAQLEIVFQEQGQVDYTAMAQGALQALGEPDNPNDLALALDYRIRHILVDEFQDTSLSQYQLIERLTAGWQADDGRTLFVVGDPMQSIYRFREAEVGLYLQARQAGIGQIPLEPLTLEVNFRSRQGIVDWINQSFASILPAVEDIANGAVTFTPSVAHHDHDPGPAVSFHPFVGDEAGDEAERVVELVKQISSAHPEETIAILVRSRSHLLEIIPCLRKQALKYQAIEIEHLGHRPVAQDLFTLTCALTHLGDRIAWLALLRAPWCGLTLADLELLVGQDQQGTVWGLMTSDSRIRRLSASGRQRLLRLQAVLNRSLDCRHRQSLRRWIEGTWLALGGPACLSSEADLEDANAFFELLERLDQGGGLRDRDLLLEELSTLFAKADLHTGRTLQVMTIHKAKGLEFDTVIVPGLGREPGRQEKHLLMWLERPRAGNHGGDLLLAPIKESGAEEDSIYKYLGYLDRQRGYYENGRLLYVAATRARRRLHLLGRCQCRQQGDGQEIKPPSAASLLHQLWPVVATEFSRELVRYRERQQPQSRQPETPAVQAQGMQRLAAEWQLPSPPAAVHLPTDRLRELEPALPDEAVEYLWAGETAKHIGTVVHRLLQQLAIHGVDNDTYTQIESLRPAIQSALAVRGVDRAERGEAGERVLAAIRRTLDDQRGRWVLDPRHREARSEHALSGIHQGKIVNVVIDRTFVDEDGVRWIIDYKTGIHTGGGLDEFLDREQQRYRGQLERYAALVRRYDDRPIRLGLYFPLLQAWREWPAAER